MSTRVQNQQLHLKASRGVPLTPEEQAQLAAWYAQLDQEEERMLASAPADVELEDLRRRVMDTQRQIEEVTRQIAEHTQANDDLRRELAVLRARLSQQTSNPT